MAGLGDVRRIALFAVLLGGGLVLALAATRRRQPPPILSFPAPPCSAQARAAPAGWPARARDLGKDGTWLRDGDGRYALLRGVNLGSRSKRPPYLPVLPLTTADIDAQAVARELERLRPELCRLEQLGVSAVRLLVIWKAVEPEHTAHWGPLSARGRLYLEALRLVVDALYAHGMLVVLDFHQDLASEAYGGDGFPDWAVAVDGEHPRPSATPAPDGMWGMRYFDIAGSPASRGARHTLRSFWRNALTNTEAGLRDDPVQTHLVRAIGWTAAFFRDHPAVLGYEPFNEPHAAGLPKAAFERDTLGAFYRAVVQEVHARDPRALVFLEPRLDWTTYPADTPEPRLLRPWTLLRFTDRPRTFLDLSRVGGAEALVFSFHYYDPWLMADLPFRSLARRARAWPATFATMAAAARASGAVPFLTEFGCTQDWTEAPDVEPALYRTVARACMDMQYRQVEAQLLNAAYWSYDFYSTRSAAGWPRDNWNQENFSLLGPAGPQNADVIARPYPLLSSGRPEHLMFDLASRHAAVLLAGPWAKAPTVLFVPRDVHYADGFEVRATTARPASWDEGRRLLYWWPDPRRPLNALALCPRGRFDPERLAASVRPLLTGVGAVAVEPAAPPSPGP